MPLPRQQRSFAGCATDSDGLPLELADVEVMVEATLRQKLIMRALLDNRAFVDHHHLVGVTDGA